MEFEYFSIMTAPDVDMSPCSTGQEETAAAVLLKRELGEGKAVTFSFPVPGYGGDIYRHVTLLPDGGVLIEDIPQARGHCPSVDGGDEFYVTGKGGGTLHVPAPIRERGDYRRPAPVPVKYRGGKVEPIKK